MSKIGTKSDYWGRLSSVGVVTSGVLLSDFLPVSECERWGVVPRWWSLDVSLWRRVSWSTFLSSHRPAKRLCWWFKSLICCLKVLLHSRSTSVSFSTVLDVFGSSLWMTRMDSSTNYSWIHTINEVRSGKGSWMSSKTSKRVRLPRRQYHRIRG